MLIKAVNGKTPEFGDDCFMAENATILGDVVAGDSCSFWFNTVVRGDVNSIRIGDRVNVQDGSVIHCTYGRTATKVGSDVSIGHNAIIHGCTIHNKVLVGMGAIVMDGCVLESLSIIAAGAVVTQKTRVASRSIYAGTPAKKIGDVNQGLAKNEIERIAQNYIEYSGWFKD
ncbi:acetyltransferase [Elysia marginata]|uniref:Acetyltransferase n=1 Tax=Elysia marginata TaxID=1093978 RepID=A0AAV4F5M5_9GAST|nr:acetyltransferase [Elysia marginata]